MLETVEKNPLNFENMNAKIHYTQDRLLFNLFGVAIIELAFLKQFIRHLFVALLFIWYVLLLKVFFHSHFLWLSSLPVFTPGDCLPTRLMPTILNYTFNFSHTVKILWLWIEPNEFSTAPDFQTTAQRISKENSQNRSDALKNSNE